MPATTMYQALPCRRKTSSHPADEPRRRRRSQLRGIHHLNRYYYWLRPVRKGLDEHQKYGIGRYAVCWIHQRPSGCSAGPLVVLVNVLVDWQVTVVFRHAGNACITRPTSGTNLNGLLVVGLVACGSSACPHSGAFSASTCGPLVNISS